MGKGEPRTVNSMHVSWRRSGSLSLTMEGGTETTGEMSTGQFVVDTDKERIFLIITINT